jgi:hypothetical protein
VHISAKLRPDIEARPLETEQKMELKPGSRWRSPVCKAEVVVVRPPKQPGVLQCGGHDMLPVGQEPAGDLALSAEHSGGVHMGKRYFDEVSGIEVLASKAGLGSLAIDGRPLVLKEAKALPSSD